ncbi:aminopeptidase P family protein [Merismopedia glauca]|uniref:Xaa-Pro aminopeptidase n=1 Tax=Merismopedia glauca CCAP 1448/3 TaxID=1296344 RepID=A0A2T1C8S5_9CYAN|nr:aminopeptidase P family protein [Merismopedia glauca]PSB04649.1 Xaa-Pro aminopeptidase [Merismopedia glauca CCAP 1448/3]
MYPQRANLPEALANRREKLSKLVDFPVILWSGSPLSRNFRANVYPFRASSHFLYFAGWGLENAAICLEAGKLELFIDAPLPSSTLWHGETPTPSAIAETIGADAVYPLSELSSKAAGAATIPVQDISTYQQQCDILGRFLPPADKLQGIDLVLAEAIVKLRSHHDAAALAEIKQAANCSIEAHLAGIRASRTSTTEAEVRAAMERVILAQQMTCAYNSIVTTHGEILHSDRYHHSLQPGDLLLADVGAENSMGWASDITRTFPVSGKFSPTQREIYQIVLAAHDDCIAKIRPGVEYRDLHLLAGEVITQGLVDLGILKGKVANLLARDAHALFFPHGVGHLLGLDVHDMEDLGDLVGYQAGRTRSDRFGLCYLRLDRPLETGMVVTIEPGLYQVPAILNDPDKRAKYQDAVNWERLAQFSDVRGIRIEDDVLVTNIGAEVLTAKLPTTIEAMEGNG